MEQSYFKWAARLFIIVIIILFLWILSSKNATNELTLNNQIKSGLFSGITTFLKSLSLTKKRKRVNKTEEQCRKILEEIFNRPFPTVRPYFLTNPKTGKRLELDCYNKELKLALEYNGQQHYTYTPRFHKNKRAFYSQVHRDDWKRRKCREMGIKLIEVPYWILSIDLKDYILKELSKLQLITSGSLVG